MTVPARRRAARLARLIAAINSNVRGGYDEDRDVAMEIERAMLIEQRKTLESIDTMRCSLTLARTIERRIGELRAQARRRGKR